MKRVIIFLICFVIIAFMLYSQQKKSKGSIELFPIVQNGKCGYIDKTGKIVINPQFVDRPGDFSKGLAVVRIGIKRGYIDKTGEYVWNPTS